jgi:hypothetical protein
MSLTFKAIETKDLLRTQSSNLEFVFERPPGTLISQNLVSTATLHPTHPVSFNRISIDNLGRGQPLSSITMREDFSNLPSSTESPTAIPNFHQPGRTSRLDTIRELEVLNDDANTPRTGHDQRDTIDQLKRTKRMLAEVVNMVFQSEHDALLDSICDMLHKHS